MSVTSGPHAAVTVIDPLTDPRWAALVARAPAASPFHHPAWLGLLARTYGYGIGAWGIEDARGGLEAGLPFARISSRLTGRRLVSVPFSDACPPLSAPGAGAGATTLLERRITADHERDGIDVELRWPLPVGEPGAGFLHHVVPLEPDVEAVVRRFAKSQVRRGIAKARRCGVTVRIDSSVGALDAFYTLHLRTRRRQGVPTQPRRFIRAFAGLFAQGLGHVALAEDDGVPIAAAVFLTAGSTVVYKYGASDPRHLGKRPNNLLFMEAIRLACEAGATALDLGRTDPGNAGLRAFKRSWGAEEHVLIYRRLTRRAITGRGGLPAGARRAIRLGPPVVGRLVGEALYRHYG